MLGIEPETVEYDGDDPVGYVLSKNLHRRHLNESQRAMVAAKIANLPQGVRKKKSGADAQICASGNEMTQDEAAAALKVSRRSVQNAARIQREAPAEVVESIERGEKTIHSALKESGCLPDAVECGEELAKEAYGDRVGREAFRLQRESFDKVAVKLQFSTEEQYNEFIKEFENSFDKFFDEAADKEVAFRAQNTRSSG
jgi:hypothetical protein